jgi:hypothetical protein
MAQERQETEISIAGKRGETINLKGDLGEIHSEPERLQKLLDVLGVPKGTEVRITTKASSSIVR